MVSIGEFINKAVENCDNEEVLASIKQEVRQLCGKFPLYPKMTF